MSCPFNPVFLLERVKSTEGFELIQQVGQLLDCVFETCEDYSDWDEDQGFGSSDMTYAVMSCLQSMTCNQPELEVKFDPYLMVTKK